MIATYSIVRTRFNKYNRLYFNGELPIPKLCVEQTYDYFGQFTYRKNKDGSVRWQKLCVSSYFDFAEEELRDVITHEMIHYYLMYKGIDMKLTHGKEFKRIMNEFNQKYGMDIKVRGRITQYKSADNAPLLPWIFMVVIGYLMFWRL